MKKDFILVKYKMFQQYKVTFVTLPLKNIENSLEIVSERKSGGDLIVKQKKCLALNRNL
jgi:hypothetical protein